MKWTIFTVLMISGAGAWLGWSFVQRGAKRGSVSVVGSTSIQPFAEMLAQDFNERQRRERSFRVEVQGGGSTAGLQAVAEGIADIGMCSRGLNGEEKARFKAIQIARDGLAIVVHPTNPVRGLTRSQIRDIFADKVGGRNWKNVPGGDNRPIRVISREEGSGTREAFVKMVMTEKGVEEPVARKAITQESNGAVKELVRNDPGAIGYMSLGMVRGELKVLQVDGFNPLAEDGINPSAAVREGKYPLMRPFLFVTPGAVGPATQAFIDFVLSPGCQQAMEREGLIPADGGAG